MSALGQKVVMVNSAWWWPWVIKHLIHQEEVCWRSFQEARGGSGQRSNFNNVGTNSTRVIKRDRYLMFISDMGLLVNLIEFFRFLVAFDFKGVWDRFPLFCFTTFFVCYSMESLSGSHKQNMATYLSLAKKKAGCLLVLQSFISLRHERWSSSSSTYLSISPVWPASSVRRVDSSLGNTFWKNFHKNIMNFGKKTTNNQLL